MAPGRLDPVARDALASLLATPRWELLPLRSALERADLLPPGASVTVTASPGKPIEATCDLTRELRRRGFRAVPHLSARMIRDRHHLLGLLAGLRDDGIDGAFVIGGDAASTGAYPDAFALLAELAELDHPLREIGIGAYPQGHPTIPTDRLDAALLAKAPFATYMTTQLCFDAAALGAWLAARRAMGIQVPLHIGIPGALQAHRLLEISARIGVRDARRFVLRHGGLLGRLLRPRGYRPTRLLAQLAPLLADPAANVRQLHLFTFNQVGPTRAWLDDYLARLDSHPEAP